MRGKLLDSVLSFRARFAKSLSRPRHGRTAGDRPSAICHAAHYDPTRVRNGASARLVEIARACRGHGLDLVHMNTADSSIYTLNQVDEFRREEWPASEIARRFRILAVMFAWSWNFESKEKVLLGLIPLWAFCRI